MGKEIGNKIVEEIDWMMCEKKSDKEIRNVLIVKVREEYPGYFKRGITKKERITYDKMYKSRYKRSHREEIKRKQCEKRGLGFRSLNKWFRGSHAHHIDKERVIYIPAELHNSVFHNLNTGKGMDKINDLAWDFLYIQ